MLDGTFDLFINEERLEQFVRDIIDGYSSPEIIRLNNRINNIYDELVAIKSNNIPNNMKKINDLNDRIFGYQQEMYRIKREVNTLHEDVSCIRSELDAATEKSKQKSDLEIFTQIGEIEDRLLNNPFLFDGE